QTFADQAVIAIGNVRLFDAEQQRTHELSEALDQQTATSEVLRVISSSPGELKPVFETMLANATRLCDAKFGVLNLYDGDAFRIVALYNVPPAYAETWGDETWRSPPGSGHAEVLRTREVVHIDDLRSMPPYREGNPSIVAFVDLAGARTFLIAPMIKENELIGTIGIYRQEVRRFTDKQIQLVKNFAAQAVIAIENTRLLKELRQRTDDLSESLEQQTATSEVLRVISSSPGELEPVFEAMLANATGLCEAKFGTLYTYDGNGFHAAAVHNAPPAYVEARKREPVINPQPDQPLGRVASTKHVAQVADITATRPYIERVPSVVTAGELAGYRTVVSVPMLKGDELIGAINLHRQEVRPFTDKQIALVTSFAEQAVIAIENTRLLNELRESLQQQTATADVLKVISRSTFELEKVLNTLVASAAQLCNAYDAAILLREGNSLVFRTHHGPIPIDFVKLPVSRGWASGRAVTDRKPVHVHDLSAERDEFPEWHELVLRQGLRTLLSVPLLRENEAIGALAVRRAEVQPFTEKQIELAETFADQAVIAIEN